MGCKNRDEVVGIVDIDDPGIVIGVDGIQHVVEDDRRIPRRDEHARKALVHLRIEARKIVNRPGVGDKQLRTLVGKRRFSQNTRDPVLVYLCHMSSRYVSRIMFPAIVLVCDLKST